jgi:hypothetical protein
MHATLAAQTVSQHRITAAEFKTWDLRIERLAVTQTVFHNVATYRHTERANVKFIQVILLFGKQKTKNTF